MTSRILILSLTAALTTFGQSKPTRNITFNGRTLTLEQEARLEVIERAYGGRLPDNRYWYDNRAGAFGVWNGPALAILPPGLELGGPMPADCSGGRTGVFINGRQLHYLDVVYLSTFVQVVPGHFWLDANGDFGYEHMPRAGNLIALANQAMYRSGSGGGQHRTYAPGELSGVIVNSAGACTSSGCFYR